MKNFFKGISFIQVLAGSLAAVTSLLLSSKIGIAGSVIGAAIGSIVSAVASQFYQNLIRASKEKIQNLSRTSNKIDDTEIMQTIGDENMTNIANLVNDSNNNNKTHKARTISSEAHEESINNTRVMELASIREQREEDMELSEGSDEPIALSKALQNSQNYTNSYNRNNLYNNENSNSDIAENK